MNRVNVNHEHKQEISDIFTLTDVVTDQSVALIPSDSNGNFSWSGITKAPIVRNAMQTSTTSSEWSDLEYPYMAVQQEDWTGGRANLRFTTDKSRFFDSKRAQTAFNSCIYNAPLDHYSTGIRKAITNHPGSVFWQAVRRDSRYIAVKFTPGSTFSASELYIHLRRRGTPESPLTVQIVDGLTENDNILTSHSYDTDEINDILAEWKKYTFGATTLTGGTTYYIKVFSSNADTENYWEVGCKDGVSGTTVQSSDGSTYLSSDFELYYRVAEYQADTRCKFFMYEQIMFMVRQTPNGTPTLWMNGDIGKVTSATSTTLTASKSWTVNAYKGARIGIVYQNGSQGNVSSWRTIASNTSNTITVDTAWDITPLADAVFVILDTPLWTQITGHGLTATVTDIHVIRGVVYFAQGDYVNGRKMRWNNGSFEWKDLGFSASFLQSVRDQNGMMMYRGMNDGINHKRCVERARLLDWNASEKTWTKITSALSTSEPVDKTVSKTVVTADTEPSPEEKKTKTTTTEVTDSNNPDTPSVTVQATATTKIGGQTQQTVATDTTQTITKTVSGTVTTLKTVNDSTKTTTDTELAIPSQHNVSTTETTTIDGVAITNTENVNTGTTVVVTTSGNNKTTTKTDTTTTTIHKEPEQALRISDVTNVVDFGSADYDAQQYVITIENFSSENYTGTCVITLQESEDGSAFQDVQSVTAIGTGTWRIFAHCKMRYRRFILTATGTNCTVNNISFATSSTLHFEDPVFLLDNYGKITRIYEYGSEQEKSLWIFQEGMVSSINKKENTVDTYNLDRFNLDELQTTADEWNGKAVATTDVYIAWAWLNGLQRHYNTQLEGKGPDHDEGMPSDMQGRITQILSYPGSFFASIDAENGYSSVMMFNGNGWHNLYKAPNAGERIHDIGFQPIYGDRPDRLWMQVGDDIVWLSMPSKILYALQDPNAEYTHESVVVSSWITGGMAEVDKLWQSISIMADNLDGVTCLIEADYQLDDEETWHPIPTNPFYISPQQEEDFAGEDESINGKKLRYRLRMQTTNMNKTPKVNVVLIKLLGRVDIKYSYAFHFRNIQYKADLAGEYEDIEPYELDEVLCNWANKLATLRLNSAYKIFDNKRVFLDGVQTSVVYEKGEGYLSQITLTEI